MKIEKTHIYFWVSSVFIFVLGFSYYNSVETEVISFNIHDTYYIIEIPLITNFVSIILFITGLVYWFFIKLNIRLFKLFIIIHFILSIGIFLAFLIGLSYFKMSFLAQNNKNFHLFDDSLNQDLFNSVLFFIFFLIQIVFVINLVISVLRHFFKPIKQ
ncbi:hypothetical protein BFR04_10400 [Gaetbulibacter sp. 4G1]|nr:hypothetical protein BFR04_10400 [Gaetbulibacter sp. 4G1]